MDLELINKNVLVIGGSKGIGLSIAQKFLEEGANVNLLARNINEQLKSDLLNLYNEQVFFHKGDATNIESLVEVSNQIIKRLKKIDIVVANVGNGKSSIDKLQTENEWEESWDVNFKSALNSANIFCLLLPLQDPLFSSLRLQVKNI